MIAIMFENLTEIFFENATIRKSLKPGAFLFQREDDVLNMFMVRTGTVDLVRTLEDGTNIVLQRARCGAVLAEASLYSARYHCAGSAAVSSEVEGMSRVGFLDLLANSECFARSWSRHLAAEVQAARYRSEILSRKTVAGRLDAWLNWHEEGLPPKGEWKSIAAQIGVSTEAFYRELARRRCNNAENQR